MLICVCLCLPRPACTLRATWTTGSFCSAVSMRSLALLASSATAHSSSPTLSSNGFITNPSISVTQHDKRKAHNVDSCWIYFKIYSLFLVLSSILCFSSRALDSIAEGESKAVAGYVEEVLQTLNDLIEYFKQPDSELEHEEKQTKLRSLRNRQNLFQEEVICMLPAKPQTFHIY